MSEPPPGPSPLVEVRVTVPDPAAAEELARAIVGQRLAACVQVLGPITSLYTWQQEVHRTQEWLLLAKSTEAAFDALCVLVQQHHRYDVPEILAVPVTAALGSYGDWVRDHSGGPLGGQG